MIRDLASGTASSTNPILSYPPLSLNASHLTRANTHLQLLQGEREFPREKVTSAGFDLCKVVGQCWLMPS